MASTAGGVAILILILVIVFCFCCARDPELPRSDNAEATTENDRAGSAADIFAFGGGFAFVDLPNRDCSVCLDKGVDHVTRCNHYFHGECIKKWITKKKLCPNCRVKLKPYDLRLIKIDN